jgi:hypothetical protein
MKSWSLAWNTADVPVPGSEASVVQVRRTGKGCLSYVVGSDGEAAIIDASGCTEVYPALIAAVSDNSHPSWRARSLSVYRFWRDLGYAVGALSAGIIADTLGLTVAIGSVGLLTFLSGVIVAAFLGEKERG